MNSSIILKDGWRLKFMGHLILLAHSEHEPRIVDIRSVKHGEEIPRDTDEPIKWDIGL